MKIHIPLERFGYVELNYEDITEFENSYVNDYLIIKAKHEEAEAEVVIEKLERISEELLKGLKEKKFKNLTEKDKMTSIYDLEKEARRLQRRNRLEKMKMKYTNKLNLR